MSVGNTPVLVRRNFGEGTMYMYLLDPNEEVNYHLSKAVYDYVLAQMEIEKHFETVETYGEYLEGYTKRKQLTDMGDFEENASVRMYENGDLKVVGVQSPYARWHCDKVNTYENTSVAYELQNAKTKIKAKLNPNTEYSYIAMPSGVKGTTISDAKGYAELSFENTSHEIFYCLPKSAENDAKISKIAARMQRWQDSITMDGKIKVEDTIAPVTTVSINGTARDDVYQGDVTIDLHATDTDNGSGVKYLEYSVDGGNFVKVNNRSVTNSGYINKAVKISGQGEHTVAYRATDNRGNVENEGSLSIKIK